MKKTVLTLLILLVYAGSQVLSAQQTENPVVKTILSGYSARSFSTVPVTDQQLELILSCGIKAPSARNSQLWKFTVVKDNALMNEIVKNTNQGNILIIVSGQENQQTGINVDFDCALATQNMYIAAQGLGLGAHIYGSPVGNINTSMKQKLGIPEGYRAITVLRVGNIDTGVDAVSTASTRKSPEELINYK
jgi:nitroreductase